MKKKPNGIDNPAFVADTEIQTFTVDIPDDEFEELESPGGFRSKIDAIASKLEEYKLSRLHPQALPFFGLCCYTAYFIWTIVIANQNPDEISWDWCNGFGFLIIISTLLYIWVFKNYILTPWLQKTLPPNSCEHFYRKILEKCPYASVVSYIGVLCLFIIFIAIDSINQPRKLIPLFGVFAFLLFSFLMSKHPGRVVWRHVAWGIGLQFVIGLIVLRWDVGADTVACVSEKFANFLAYTDSGSKFVFGHLIESQPFNASLFPVNSTEHKILEHINISTGFVFFFKVLSVVYFFSFFVSMLFYAGIMQKIVSSLGWLLQITIGTTACESMNAAGNIFLGQSESPLMIRPYLPKMTNSEIHSVMTGGFSTIAGAVMAAYISFGISPSHLLSASVMSAPAALAVSKIMYPETKVSKTTSSQIESEMTLESDSANILDAAAKGAMDAAMLVLNIAACLIAFLAFVPFVNSMVSWFTRLIGHEVTVTYLLGKIFVPSAWLLGVDNKDIEEVGELLAFKTFINEFVAYKVLSDSKTISLRSKTIAVYALCGFSNPSSMGIQIAALSTMAPNKRQVITEIAPRALMAGYIACCLTACIAGILSE